MTSAASPRRDRPLWRCPHCRRRFASRNLTHTCARHTLAHHFAGKSPAIRGTYQSFLRAVRECGPVTVLPQKSRIGFQVRMTFAQITPRTHWVDGHVVLARRVTAACVRRIDSLSPRNHVHHFRLSGPDDITPELRALLAEAYEVGQQRHLRAPPRT